MVDYLAFNTTQTQTQTQTAYNIFSFRIQVEHLQKSLDETHEMVNKLQNMLSSRTELNQKLVIK